MLMPNRLPHVGIPDSKIAGVDTGENLSYKFRSCRLRKIQRFLRIPENIDAEGNPNILFQLTDDPAHAGYGHGLHIRQIRKAEFIGKHHCVHTALLKRDQILSGPFNNLLHTV